MDLAYHRADHPRAFEHGLAELELRRAAGERLHLAKAATDLAMIGVAAGQSRAALELAEEAYAIFVEELGPTHAQSGRAAMALGWMLSSLGELVRAEPLLRDAVRVLADTPEVVAEERVVAMSAYADVLRALERFDDARDVLVRALEIAKHDTSGGPRSILAVRLSQASIELEAGAHEAAVAILESIRTETARLEGPTSAENRVTWCVNLATALARAGERARSLAEADACRPQVLALAAEVHRGAALRHLGEVYRRGDRRDDARACLDSSIEQLTGIDAVAAELAEAHLGRAELSLDEGDRAASRRDLALAERSADGAPPALRRRLTQLRATLQR
jgi:tetratricopeptide (TPR) repeat protein